jgi:hypothetical protein
MILSCSWLICFESPSLPPAVSHNTNNGKRGNHQVDDPIVQTLCRLVTQLLGSLGADGALRLYLLCGADRKDQKQDGKNASHYVLNSFGLHLFGQAVPFVLVEDHLTHANEIRSHFDALIVLDIFHALL